MTQRQSGIYNTLIGRTQAAMATTTANGCLAKCRRITSITTTTSVVSTTTTTNSNSVI